MKLQKIEGNRYLIDGINEKTAKRGVKGYSRFLGILASCFGLAIKCQDKTKKTIYLSKASALAYLRRNGAPLQKKATRSMIKQALENLATTRTHSKEPAAAKKEEPPAVVNTPVIKKEEPPVAVIPPVTKKEEPPAVTPSLPKPVEPPPTVFEQENKDLREKILKTISEAKLPLPVDNYQVMEDVHNMHPATFKAILNKEMEAPSPLHRQAIIYIKTLENSQSVSEHQIIPNVFVGSYEALQRIDPKQGNNPSKFTRVISVTRLDPSEKSEFWQADIPADIDRMTIKVNDDDTAWTDLKDHFDKIFQKIDLARQEKKSVLIHCSQGQSRSVTVMIAYLINRFALSYEEAITYVKTKRFLAEPVPGLEHRLKAYAEEIKNS